MRGIIPVALRRDGEIGRRAGFRNLCRKAWRFDSSSRHINPLNPMGEKLTDAYLQSVVAFIDTRCLACHRAEDDDAGSTPRAEIRDTLTLLGTQWDEQGAEGTTVTDAMKQACDYCLADNRTKLRLFSLTCGIATRLPEHLNQDRKK
jgi:hypothetical protein